MALRGRGFAGDPSFDNTIVSASDVSSEAATSSCRLHPEETEDLESLVAVGEYALTVEPRGVSLVDSDDGAVDVGEF